MVAWAVCLSSLMVSQAVRAERKWEEPPKPAPLISQRPIWPSHPILCSDRRPLCVHVQSKQEASRLAPALVALEKEHARIVDVLGWRPPQSDLGLGPTDGFDLYLSPHEPFWVTRPDPLTDTSPLARTSAFAYVNPALMGTCAFDFAVGASLARAGIYALDVAANEALANASASYVASVVEPCPTAFVTGIDDFQMRPYLAVSNAAHDQGRGALLFPWFLQETRGWGRPLDLLHVLWAISAQPSAMDSATVLNEPDFVDVVGVAARNRQNSLSDLWLDFAVTRAFIGDRDDGLHLPNSRFVGAAGAIRFEWSVDYSSLPRRLAPVHPVEPSGSSYLWLSLDKLPKGAGLGFRADWEAPDVFRFALLLVDQHGNVLSRHDPVSPERGTQLESNIEVLSGGASVLVVVCNTGSVLRDLAFDPDNDPYTARSYTVSLFAQ